MLNLRQNFNPIRLNVNRLFSMRKFNLNNSTRRMFSTFTQTDDKEINVKSDEKNFYYPIRGIPEFTNGQFTVFQFNDNADKLPLIPYEIKECAMKGFLYTFFLLHLFKLQIKTRNDLKFVLFCLVFS